MNKADLVRAVSARLGSRTVAVAAVDAILAEIQSAVARGERVVIAGFGVFERESPARDAPVRRRAGDATTPTTPSVVFRPAKRFQTAVEAAKVSRADKAPSTSRKVAAKRKAVKKAPAARKAGPPPGPDFPTEP